MEPIPRYLSIPVREKSAVITGFQTALSYLHRNPCSLKQRMHRIGIVPVIATSHI